MLDLPVGRCEGSFPTQARGEGCAAADLEVGPCLVRSWDDICQVEVEKAELPGTVEPPKDDPWDRGYRGQSKTFPKCMESTQAWSI